MVHMSGFLWKKLMSGWNDSSPRSRLEVSAAVCQGCLGFALCQTPAILRLRGDLLRVSLIILRSDLFQFNGGGKGEISRHRVAEALTCRGTVCRYLRRLIDDIEL